MTDCAFARGGDPAAAYDDLAAHDRRGIRSRRPSTASTARSGRGELDIGVASALYAGRDGYDDARGGARAGRRAATATRMLALADEYTGRQHRREVLERDRRVLRDGLPRRARAADGRGGRSSSRRARRASRPHFGASTVWLGLPCTLLARARGGQGRADPRAGRAADRRRRHDRTIPATPYAWAQALARELQSGRLLTADGDEPHLVRPRRPVRRRHRRPLPPRARSRPRPARAAA